MKKIFFFLAGLLIAGNVSSYGKAKSDSDTLFTAFWNLENLFDTIDDPGKEDEEFTPNGANEWTTERLDTKLNHLAQVINSMNKGNGPDVMGFSEVEHKALIETMIDKYFNNKNYGIAYAESPDARGIDVGLIYKKDKFRFLSVHTDTVVLPDKYPTRLILNANIITTKNDTLSLFINHWPSRRGGEEKSEINRVSAARVLRNHLDRIIAENVNVKFIIMGDFNDQPSNKSIKEILCAAPVYCDSIEQIQKQGTVLNLAYRKHSVGEGSYFFSGKFEMIDQIMVSGSLLTGKNISYICESFEVYKPSFMVEKSGRYKGSANPTFGGKKYLGGYSDHFPVTAKFVIN